MLLRIFIFFSSLFLATLQQPGSTISEPSSVDLVADAWALRKAMKGWGTDEQAIINILTKRRYNTRLMLSNIYEREVDRNLWSDVKSETSGTFRTALKGLLMTEAQFLAEEMRGAMKGWGTNEDTLINCLMLTIRDHATVRAIKSYYLSLYDETLKERIEDETTGDLETFLVGVLERPSFDESAEPSAQTATSDLEKMKLYVQEKRIGDIATLLTGMSLRRISVLQGSYYRDSGNEVELVTALSDITGHHIRDCFTSLLLVSRNYNYYVAHELNASLEGRGTDEGTLTRIIVTRADKDLVQIKNSYTQLTDRELKKDVHDDTSGDYRKTLLALIN